MNSAAWPDVFPRDINKPNVSRDAKDYPWIFKCGTPGCYWQTAHPTEENAHKVREQHLAETCPLTGHTQHNDPVEVLMTIISKLWGHLDEATAAVMDGKPGEDATADDHKVWNEKRGAARAFAVAVFEIVYPEAPDSTAIAKEAVRRYKSMKAGEELELPTGMKGRVESQFLAQERDKAKKKEAQEAHKKAEKAAPKAEDMTDLTAGVKPAPSAGVNNGVDLSKIKPDTITLIENGIKAGGSFTDDMLAKLGKVKVEVVQAIRAKLEAG